MAINTEGLRVFLSTKIKEALDTYIDNNSDSDTVKQNFSILIANAISDGVDAWIKTATVIVQPGIPVVTSGSSITQAGETISAGNGIIL